MPSLPIPPPTRTAQGEAFLGHTARMAPPQETRPGPQDKVPVVSLMPWPCGPIIHPSFKLLLDDTPLLYVIFLTPTS